MRSLATLIFTLCLLLVIGGAAEACNPVVGSQAVVLNSGFGVPFVSAVPTNAAFLSFQSVGVPVVSNAASAMIVNQSVQRRGLFGRRSVSNQQVISTGGGGAVINAVNGGGRRR